MSIQTIFLTIISLLLLIIILYCIKNFAKILNSYVCGIKIDENKKILFLNERQINFNDIKNLVINEDIEDISISERLFYGDTGRLVVDRLIFTLTDDSEEVLYTRRRCQVYRILKALNKYVKINYDIDLYKEPLFTTYEIFINIIILLIYLIFFRHMINPLIIITLLVFVYIMQRGDYLYK